MINKKVTNCFESLVLTVAFDVKDWGKYEKDAWLYGIIMGWSNDDLESKEYIYKEFKVKFGWTRETWNRLEMLHKQFLEYIEISKDIEVMQM